jgi:hypothetical protein
MHTILPWIFIALAVVTFILAQYLKFRNGKVMRLNDRILKLVSKKGTFTKEELFQLADDYQELERIYLERKETAKAKVCRAFADGFMEMHKGADQRTPPAPTNKPDVYTDEDTRLRRH